MVDDDYAYRLSLAMGAKGERPSVDQRKALARALGVHVQAINKYWSGGSNALTAANNSAAAAYLRVDPDWLATGKGQMRSAKVWPFGEAVTPETFFALDRATVQSAIDVIESAARRAAVKPADTEQIAGRQPVRARTGKGRSSRPHEVADRLESTIAELEKGTQPADGEAAAASGPSRRPPKPLRAGTP